MNGGGIFYFVYCNFLFLEIYNIWGRFCSLKKLFYKEISQVSYFFLIVVEYCEYIIICWKLLEWEVLNVCIVRGVEMYCFI